VESNTTPFAFDIYDIVNPISKLKIKYNRHSIRLPGYDYSQSGLYFITICCRDQICHFGDIENGFIYLNDIGAVVQKCWIEIPLHYPNVELHQYVIMPNHFHGIIQITDNFSNIKKNVGAKNLSPVCINNDLNMSANNFSHLRGTSKTVGSIVRGFKIGVTKWIRANTSIDKLWQRNYYEHIIRDYKSYLAIVDYIIHNPVSWEKDSFYVNYSK
jgi:putative transposase